MPEMRQEWSEFIRERAENLGSQTALALALGISQSSVSNWIKYGLVPKEMVIKKAAKQIGDDPREWLAAAGYINGNESAIPTPIQEVSEAYVPVPSTARLPVRGVLRAGEVTLVEEVEGDYFYCTPEHATSADYVVKINGRSMAPAVVPGEYLAVKQGTNPVPGDIVVARRGDDRFVKRFVRKSPKEGVLLRSDNEEYADISGKDIEIIGIVVWKHSTVESLRRKV